MASELRRVLIGGGTGFIGSTLKHLLQKEGFQVTIISRKSGENRITWDDVSKTGLPEHTTVVVNVAGENVLNPFKRWTDDFKREVIDSRIQTTKLLARAIEDAKEKPKVFVSMSGVGIYKPNNNVTYDEYSELDGGFDFISKLAHQWEDAARTTNVRTVTIRSGVVLGRNGGMIQQIFLPFFIGLGGPIGNGQQYFPWIHLHDLCRLILFSIENDRVTGVINGVAPQMITNKEFTTTFARALHRPAIFPLPSFIVKLIFGSERSIMMLEGQKVTPAKVSKEYGFKFSYPTIDAACSEFAKLRYSPPALKAR